MTVLQMGGFRAPIVNRRLVSSSLQPYACIVWRAVEVTKDPNCSRAVSSAVLSVAPNPVALIVSQGWPWGAGDAVVACTQALNDMLQLLKSLSQVVCSFWKFNWCLWNSKEALFSALYLA